MDCCGFGWADEPTVRPAAQAAQTAPAAAPQFEWGRWCGVTVVPIDEWPPTVRIERDGVFDTLTLHPLCPRDPTEHRCYGSTWRGERVFVKWMEEGECGARHADDEDAAAIACHAMGGLVGAAPFASGVASGELGVVGVTVAVYRPAYTPRSARQMGDVLRQMAALDRIGVSYLDLKASNLVGGLDGRPEIVDVGSLYPPTRRVGRGTELQITYLPADLDLIVPFEHLTFDYQPPGAIAYVHDTCNDDDPAARREVRMLSLIATVWTVRIMTLNVLHPGGTRARNQGEGLRADIGRPWARSTSELVPVLDLTARFLRGVELGHVDAWTELVNAIKA